VSVLNIGGLTTVWHDVCYAEHGWIMIFRFAMKRSSGNILRWNAHGQEEIQRMANDARRFGGINEARTASIGHLLFHCDADSLEDTIGLLSHIVGESFCLAKLHCCWQSYVEYCSGLRLVFLCKETKAQF
jgi:hypothetical protein